MKIKSDFKDYYDGFQSNDTDKETLWIRQRKRTPVVLDKNTPRNIRHFFEDSFHFCKCRSGNGPDFSCYYWSVIGVAGKIYPAYVIKKDKTTYVFDSSLHPHYNYYHFFSHHTKQNPWYKIYTDDANLVAHLFNTYGPIWSIGTGCLCEKLNFVNENPCLSEYGFQKVVPIHEIYNELYKFVCNMQRPTKPIPEMSNDLKIHQAGFDLKTSFRKSKGERNTQNW